jgi:hypothetical protein
MSKSKSTKHTILGALLEVEMSKKCTPLWREAPFQVKIKHTSAGSLLESCDSKKCTPWWHEAPFKVKMLKTPHVWTSFGGSDVVRVARARDCAPCQK